MAALKCPKCGLFSPASAERCDCGFRFVATSATAVSRLSTVSSTSHPTSAELELKGRQGKTLSVSGDTIRILKKGLIGQREKTILIRNVTSVEVKRPGGFAGFIQFSIAGGRARDSSYTLTGGAYDAVTDENSVVFNGQEDYEIALKIKAYVESWSSAPARVNPPPQAVPDSAADEIRKLKVLLDEGILTPEEFSLKKKQLLGI